MNDIREDMCNDTYLTRKTKLDNLMKEMMDFSSNITDEYQKTDEYKEKYKYYFETLKSFEEEETYDEEEIDIDKNKNNPYLKLKYWISEYVYYYRKMLKSEYLGVKNKLDIKIDISNIEATINEFDNKISNLENEEKINYIFNLDNIITKELK